MLTSVKCSLRPLHPSSWRQIWKTLSRYKTSKASNPICLDMYKQEAYLSVTVISIREAIFTDTCVSKLDRIVAYKAVLINVATDFQRNIKEAGRPSREQAQSPTNGLHIWQQFSGEGVGTKGRALNQSMPMSVFVLHTLHRRLRRNIGSIRCHVMSSSSYVSYQISHFLSFA